MGREILFATTNLNKIARFQEYFKELGLTVVSFSDVGSKVEVIEDGKTPEENARKKALAGYNATGKPSFGIDYWLTIVGLPENMQPGPYVRRIYTGNDNQRVEASDEQMLEYYSDKVKMLGGKVKAVWTSAIALTINPEKTHAETFIRETIMVSERSENINEDEPLNSIQIDPRTGKYLSDLTKDELLNLQKQGGERYIGFMKKHLQEI